jgi:hypothetical protein
MSRVYVSVTNSNRFWIVQLDLLTASFTVTHNHNQLKELTVFSQTLLPWLPRTCSILILILWLHCTLLYFHSLASVMLALNCSEGQSEVKVMLRSMVSRPVSLGINHPSRAQDQIVSGLLIWGTLSDKRLGLLFASVTVSLLQAIFQHLL